MGPATCPSLDKIKKCVQSCVCQRGPLLRHHLEAHQARSSGPQNPDPASLLADPTGRSQSNCSEGRVEEKGRRHGGPGLAGIRLVWKSIRIEPLSFFPCNKQESLYLKVFFCSAGFELIVLASVSQSQTLRSSLCCMQSLHLHMYLHASISHSHYLACYTALYDLKICKHNFYVFLYALPSYFILLFFFLSENLIR